MFVVDDIYCAYVISLTGYNSHLWLMLSVYGYCDISGYRPAIKI